MECFYRYDPTLQIILTLPADWMHYWEACCTEHAFSLAHTVAEGGTERYHSIRGALDQAEGTIIAVHDGVRPLVSRQTIADCFNTARVSGTAIPCLPVTESLREKTDTHTRAVDRAHYLTVQTPQCFQSDILKRAYEQPYHSGITDDASLVEASGVVIHLVQGNIENIKITNPLDLKVAELFIEHLGDAEII